MSALLVSFFRHNLWANLTLLDVCAGLSDADLDAGAPGTFGNARDTLVHIVAAEGRYLALVTSQVPEGLIWEQDGFPGFDVLRARALEYGEGLIAGAAGARDDQQVHTIFDGRWQPMPVSLPLLQTLNHGTEHRAHVGTVLSQRGIEPPTIDGWAFDAATRTSRAAP